jgi:hypothetical protein
VVPPDSHRISRGRCYSGYRRIWSPHTTGLSPSVAAVPGYSHSGSSSLCGPTTPGTLACSRFRPFPFRSPLLWESRLIFIPAVTEMCHFTAFARHASMDSKHGNPDCSGLGCPIRRSQDPLVCSSPGLFAAYHVLHRLSAPRHPPYTLSNLTALIPLPELHSSVSVRIAIASQRRRGSVHENISLQNGFASSVVHQFTTPHCSRVFISLETKTITRLQNTHLQLSKIYKLLNLFDLNLIW